MVSLRLRLLSRPAVIAILTVGFSLLASAAVIAADQPPGTAPRPAQDDPTPEPNGAAIIDTILNVDPYLAWESWPSDERNSDDFSGYLPGESPHGNVVRIFVNTVALDAVNDPAFAGDLPPGSIIVKENYAPTHDHPAELVALTVMVKFEDFYPASGNWFWVKAAPDGRLINAEGAVTRCITCHETSESDYLLRYTFSGTTGSAGLDGDMLIDTRCTACHTRDRIDTASKDAAGWTATVDRMIGYGAPLNDTERAALIDFLSGTAPASSAPTVETLNGERLIDTRCTACHTRDRIDAASKDAAGWTATVDRMIGYGAPLSSAERDHLIGYLAQRGAAITVDPNNAEMIINVRCSVCHTRARIDEEDDDLEGWNETVNRMVSYGAQLSAQEWQTLLNYLVATHGKSDDDDSGKGRGRGRGGDDQDDDD